MKMEKLLVVTALAFSVFVISISQTSAQTIYACYSKKSGAMRFVAEPGKCKKTESEISWNTVGPQGPAGPEGPAGASTGAAFLGTKEMTLITKYYGGSPWTTVVTVNLPAGTYLLTGDGVVNRLTHQGGSGIAVNCRLTGGGAVLPYVYFSGPTLETTSVALGGRVYLAVDGTATMECTHNDFADTVVQGVGFELLAQGVTVQVNP
jgi:hypothetical protein